MSTLRAKISSLSMKIYKYAKNFIRCVLERLFDCHSKVALQIHGFNSIALSKFLASIIMGAISIFLTVILCFIVLRSTFVDIASLGAFGDFIGGTLNPILSFLTLIAVLLTISIQNRELAATREELSASRDAQEEQAKRLGEQLDLSGKKEKSDITFKILERWTSPQTRDQRMISWEYFEKHQSFKNDQKIKISDMSHEDPKTFRALTDVAQFVSDFQKLLVAERLDNDLAYQLFVGPVYPWFEVFELVRVSPGRNAEHQRPSGARVDSSDAQRWYDEIAKFKVWFDDYEEKPHGSL